MLNVDLADLIEFAKNYGDLGDAVQEQLDDLLNGTDSDLNPNAVRLIKQVLGGSHEEIDAVCTKWLKKNGSKF